MIDFQDVIQSAAAALEDYKAVIVDRQRELGEVASGRTAASFRVEVLPDGVALVGGGEGTAPVGTLEIGSRPHWAPIAPLKEWVAAKGLSVSPWAVQRKIAKFGTDRFAKPVQVWSQDVDEVAQRIADDVAARFGSLVTAKLSEIYKPSR